MKKYPKYKDSGVEWIGEIPEGWEVISLKRLCKIRRGASPRPIDDEKYFDDNGEYSWVRISDVSASERYLTKTEQKLSELGASLSVKMNPQDIFLSIAGSVGKPIITEIKCCIHDGFVWFENLKYDKEFLFRIFDLGTCFSGLGKFGTQLNLNTDTIGSIWVPNIPIPEQQQIVTYLDHKTTLIDQIISGSEKKIEILKEQRTATINHAVTKGLNPKVKMKDSGVEWIGEIPEGWTIVPLKSITDVRPSNVDKHIYPEEIQVDLCNYTDVYKNEFVGLKTPLKQGSCSETEYSRFNLKKGDVIITKDSESPDDIGIPCLIIDDLPNVVCGYHLTLLRPINIEGGFLYRVFQTQYIKSYFETESNGITRFALGKSTIESTSIVSPPIQEQQQIVTYLDQKTKEIDDLISSEQKRIELMKEYRQSLISEVVTGKIKVTSP
jgi:type I restriction enzyme S subunit